MKISSIRFLMILSFILPAALAFGQPIAQRLSSSLATMEKDSQFSNAIVSLYVADATTGEMIYSKNAQLGLAPASSLKVLTAATAYEILGRDYLFKTGLQLERGGNGWQLNIYGSGDPTFGSWRWPSTKILQGFEIIRDLLAKNMNGDKTISIAIYENGYDANPLPEGWIWQDMGNYYGAAAWGFNWHENQFDLHLRSAAIGDTTQVVGTTPVDLKSKICNNITAAAKGSGDRGYIFSSPFASRIFTTGTIPERETKFTISGSLPDPSLAFITGLTEFLNGSGFRVKHSTPHLRSKNTTTANMLWISSPSLDSIQYYFLQRSINLYGEAMLKKIAHKQTGLANTGKGIEQLQAFWRGKGIPKNELTIFDGSGLSPANRITSKALTTVMVYAKKRNWFTAFYNGLPTINNLKMKSGNINGVMSYTGYAKSKQGREYAFCIIVNNYNGSASAVRNKLFNVLNMLK